MTSTATTIDAVLTAGEVASSAKAPTAAVASLVLDAEHTQQPLVHRIGPGETLMTLSESAKLLPTIAGRKIGISALWRWARQGVRGVRLPYLRAGRRILTSRESLFWFCQTLADLDERVGPADRVKPTFINHRPISSRRRQQALAAADAVLARARI